MFFTADDGMHGTELWKSNGSSTGSVLVKDVRSGDYSSNPSSLTAVGRTLFFTAQDGTRPRAVEVGSAGTGSVLFKDIHPCSTQYGPASLTRAGKRLFFVADNGTHGRELWRSNGTSSDTVLVKDINTRSQ